jgi:hypothetical protein
MEERIPLTGSAAHESKIIEGDTGLEPTLIEVSGADVVIMGVPALRVHQRQPADEPRAGVVTVGPQHEVEVVGHDTEGEQTHGDFVEGFGQDAEEGIVSVSGACRVRKSSRERLIVPKG